MAVAATDEQPISRHDLIAEVVAKYPDAAEVLMDFGVGCVGCHISEFETLEQGILGHGFTEDELEEVLSDLNEIAQTYGDQEISSLSTAENEESEEE